MATNTIPLPQATATSGAQPAAGGAIKPLGIPASGAPAAGVNTPQAVAATNPLVPPAASSAGTIPAAAGGTGTPATAPADPNAANLSKQETDIFGKGVGGELTNLIGNISGVNSQSIADYTASLQPAEAQAQATLNTTMGAQGVSGNSSVAALGDASLQAQETAAIAGETAQLRQSGQQLEAGILTGQQSAAAQEVASSGWQVFGNVLNSLGSDAAQVASAYVKG